jgi:hypothetical protein
MLAHAGSRYTRIYYDVRRRIRASQDQACEQQVLRMNRVMPRVAGLSVSLLENELEPI